MNLIRLDDMTNLLANGEVPQARLLVVNECKPVGQTAKANTGCTGCHRVVEDGMDGRCYEITWEVPVMTVPYREFRANIVAVKWGNSHGAKGGRKMDVQ
jgi:hypothetical protein